MSLTIEMTSFRRSGSPPVNRNLLTPKPTNVVAILWISSLPSKIESGRKLAFSFIQYEQRRLHLSVKLILALLWTLPKVSERGPFEGGLPLSEESGRESLFIGSWMLDGSGWYIVAICFELPDGNNSLDFIHDPRTRIESGTPMGWWYRYSYGNFLWQTFS